MGQSGDGKRNILWGWPNHASSKDVCERVEEICLLGFLGVKRRGDVAKWFKEGWN